MQPSRRLGTGDARERDRAIQLGEQPHRLREGRCRLASRWFCTADSIVREALAHPARRIAANAGHEGSVVVAHIRADEKKGFDAATGEYVDMVKAGIIDPAKVTRSALQNAASIAALVLTTESTVVEKPEVEERSWPRSGCMIQGAALATPLRTQSCGCFQRRLRSNLRAMKRLIPIATLAILFGASSAPADADYEGCLPEPVSAITHISGHLTDLPVLGNDEGVRLIRRVGTATGLETGTVYTVRTILASIVDSEGGADMTIKVLRFRAPDNPGALNHRWQVTERSHHAGVDSTGEHLFSVENVSCSDEIF